MEVHGYATDPEWEWTKPFPTAPIGYKLRLLGGDLFSPDLRNGTLRPGHEGEKKNWFNTIPARVRREYAAMPKWLFLSIGIGWFGFYFGHKVFGADSDAYKDWPGVTEMDIYHGSRALTGITIRFTTKRPRDSAPNIQASP